jgi:hypothetical protein
MRWASVTLISLKTRRRHESATVRLGYGLPMTHRVATANPYGLVGAFCAAMLSPPLCAESEPLWVENLSPLAQVRALPAAQSAFLSTGWGIALHGAVASHYVVENSAQHSASLFFDGETQAQTLSVQVPLAPRWQLQVDLPLRRHSAGFLDPVINDWHNFFGLPDGGRNSVANGQFGYQIVGEQQIALEKAVSGVADATLSLAYQLFADDAQASSLVVGYQPGHGNEQQWLGSGTDQWWLALRYSAPQSGTWPLMWHFQGGWSQATQGTVLGIEQHRGLWFAGVSAEWQVSDHWSLLAQYDGHRGLLTNSVSALTAPASLLSLGARWRASPHWSVTGSFSEDIAVGRAPDVTFQLGLQYRP